MTSGPQAQQNRTSGPVLVAPLDWGLGHATRCVPVIKALQNKGFEVCIAADGKVSHLMAAEFPGIRILPLPGYQIRYSGNRMWFLAGLLGQIPRAAMTFLKSRRLVKKWVKERGISLIISDNRPELHDCGTASIYMTHQLEVKTGRRYLNRMASGIHRYFINRFQQCWVPDEEGQINLAGKLSHPLKMPSAPVTYIGCLTRFSNQVTLTDAYDLLILLSGPEPQRTLLEKKILNQIENTTRRICLVRGLPGEKETKPQISGIDIFNHLPSGELNKLLLSSAMIVARCGYSTVMDLALLGKKAILIPTPGQGEQEYLAHFLKEKKYFYTVSQDELEISRDMETASGFAYKLPELHGMREDAIINGISRQSFTDL